MKKIFAALLAALMVFSLCACKKKDEDGGSNIDMSVTADKNIFETGNEFGDTFTYQVVNGNEISITGFDGSDVPHAVTLPLSIHDYAVTEVGAGAFYQKSNLLSVTVPEGIKKIGNFAFSGCTQMTGVTLPATLLSVGDGAFTGCASLTRVELPESVQTLGAMMFFNCEKLASVKLPAGLKEIPAQFAMNCPALTTVEGGAALTKIGAHAFFACTALATMPFPGTLTEIGDYAFANCLFLTKPTLGADVKIGEIAFTVVRK